MATSNEKEKELRSLFQQKKANDHLNTPAFAKIFDQAQQKKQTTRRFKLSLLAASITILAIISFVVNEDRLPANLETITIAKSSTQLYERLMVYGKIVTNDIHFEYDIATIKASSMPVIESLATMLKKYDHIRLNIEGHTDSTGDYLYNEQLSYARAYEVRRTLIKLGVQAERLTAEGFGESKPTSDNNTEKGRALNRRVAFVLVK